MLRPSPSIPIDRRKRMSRGSISAGAAGAVRTPTSSSGSHGPPRRRKLSSGKPQRAAPTVASRSTFLIPMVQQKRASSKEVLSSRPAPKLLPAINNPPSLGTMERFPFGHDPIQRRIGTTDGRRRRFLSGKGYANRLNCPLTPKQCHRTIIITAAVA